MDLGLKDKVALVLASSSGLGYATAQALAAEGAWVHVCSRNLARAQEAAERILADSGRSEGVVAHEADVASESSLKALFEAIPEGLDILVCNAGGPPPGTFDVLDESKWERAYQLTLQSVVRSVRLALPGMRARGGGSILALASSSVKVPIDNLLLSNVFRPAVNALCKALSLELAADSIRVNCLSPGRIATARIRELDEAKAKKQHKSLAEVQAESLASIPLGRLGEGEEFGRVAAFLCSDAASYMTGSSLYVDGGMIRAL